MFPRKKSLTSHALTVVYHRAAEKTREREGKQTTQPGVRKSGAEPKLCKMTANEPFFPASGAENP